MWGQEKQTKKVALTSWMQVGTLELLQALGLVHYLIIIEIYRHDLSGMQVGNLELLQAPGLPFNLPRQYASLPRLTGACAVGVGLFWGWVG